MMEQNMDPIDHEHIPTKHFNRTPLLAHLSMFSACAVRGLMASIGGDAMLHRVNDMSMVSFRILGGAILFWVGSLFVKHEHVPLQGVLWFVGAAVFGLVCNQCYFTIGLSYTSPINISIVTTSMLIFAMVLAALVLKEPIAGKKAMGVLIGCRGVLILILTSMTVGDTKVSDIRGDLMVMRVQLSCAFYLSAFNKLVKRYSVFTINKWMLLWATCLIWLFSLREIVDIPWAAVSTETQPETAYVVFLDTFAGYILVISVQRMLRPTVVSSYSYVQPVVAVVVTVLTGMGIFKWTHGLAVFMVFMNVWMVTESRSRHNMVDSKGELIRDSVQQSTKDISKACEEKQPLQVNKSNKKDIFFL